MPGYQHETYARSLEEFGTPRHLAKSDGWILTREIAGSTLQDSMGCYPIFSCRNWSLLHEDLSSQDNNLVSLTLVTDPFGNYELDCLKDSFPDLLIPFKLHYVVELSQPPDTFVQAHHRKNAQKALQSTFVEHMLPSDVLLAEWVGLYDNLIARHHIRGISAFSFRSLAAQLRVPGLVVFRAGFEGGCAGMTLWYVQGDVAYYHLGAYSDEGYKRKASFALFWKSIEYFRETGLRWLSLGAGAGMQQTEDGLTRFKSGWATGTRTAYLCGRIINRTAYNELSESRGLRESAFFPAYRSGETI